MEGDTIESLSRLSLNLLEFLNTEDYERLLNITDSFPEYYRRDNQFDVIVRAGGEDCYCNSDVLSLRSSYFRNALLHHYAAKEGPYIILEEPNISPNTFKMMLRYFYNGEIDLNKLDGGLCIDLLNAANHFRLDEFIEKLQQHIINNKTTWLQINVIRIVNGVFTKDGDERIRHHLIHKINENPWYLLKSNELGTLKSSCFITLVDDECFHVNQGILWDILIEWGIQQNPTLGLDVSNWTYKDWMTLKAVVKELIPNIKFSIISRNDYYGKILPFSKMISKKEQNLEDEKVLLCYLDKDISTPNSKILRQIFLDDSSIINHFHANIILQWINEGREGQETIFYPKIKKSFLDFFCFVKKPKRHKSFTSALSITYQFNLLFSRRQNGFPVEDYHKKCDNIPNTLVVAKVHDSRSIVGGFAPKGLDSTFSLTPTIDSNFLFNFKNGEPSIENTVLCKMRKEKEIESEYVPYLWVGPRFGAKDLAIDLHKMKATSVPQSYDKPIHDAKEFSLDDVEVYQVVKC